MDFCTVTILPQGKQVKVLPRMTLREAIILAGWDFAFPCGGKGTCGKCKIKVCNPDLTVPQNQVKSFLTDQELKSGIRLACQTKIENDIQIELVELVRRNKHQHRKSSFAVKQFNFKLNPVVKKIDLILPPPDINVPVDDWSNLTNNLPYPNLTGSLSILKSLPKILRDNQFKVSVTVNNNRVVKVAPIHNQTNLYGIALDIGTTTVAGSLINLSTGELVATTSEINSQAKYGEDVISRINYVIDHPEGLTVLHREIILTTEKIINLLLSSYNLTREDVYDIFVVGNTAMQHLFLGIDPQSLTFAPYVPALKTGMSTSAASIGLAGFTYADVFVAPNIAGFVGGDTLSMILSLNLHHTKDTCLAIDLGTNGEIVLVKNKQLYAVSTAAGSAFEGIHLHSGVRAIPGAIDAVEINERGVIFRTIDNQPPCGICGSGYIDLIAGLVAVDLINHSGQFTGLTSEIKDKPVYRNLHHNANSSWFNVYQNGTVNILFTQNDIRKIQLAKSAIRAGMEMLQKIAGVTDTEIRTIYLAGTFGNFIDKCNAQRIGLLPEIDLEKVQFVGNAALDGAVMSLLSRPLRKEIEQVARSVHHIELSAKPEFQDIFVDQLMFN